MDQAHTSLMPHAIPTIIISIDSKPAPHGTMKVVDREVTPFDDPTNMWEYVQRTLFGQTVYLRDNINLHHICL